MKEYLNKLPQEIRELVYLACDIASGLNMSAYLVGGFVRDLILGVENLDLDIVVEGEGIRFAEDFARTLGSKLVRHRRFGTATVIIKPHLKVDIATARSEVYPAPARLPVVTGGTLKDDLLRRDFTINAMAISITPDNFGRLVDLYAGRSDLKNRKIRVLHDLSFIDDPTRILRAVRFEKRYNFKIEPKTLKLLKESVRLKMLEKVEPQRIRDDLILVLKEKKPLKEIRRINELAGFGFINPELKITRRAYGLLNAIEKEINWFNKKYPERRNIDAWLIYLIGLLDALDTRVIKNFCRSFAFKRGEEKRILDYKGISSGLISKLSKEKVKPSQIFCAFEPLSYEVILILKAKYKNRYLRRHIEDFLEIYNGMRIFVSGHDLHDLGLAPGPKYQKIFASVLNAKLDGEVKTKEEELELIKSLIKLR